jgi:hypothetical protein
LEAASRAARGSPGSRIFLRLSFSERPVCCLCARRSWHRLCSDYLSGDSSRSRTPTSRGRIPRRSRISRELRRRESFTFYRPHRSDQNSFRPSAPDSVVAVAVPLLICASVVIAEQICGGRPRPRPRLGMCDSLPQKRPRLRLISHRAVHSMLEDPICFQSVLRKRSDTCLLLTTSILGLPTGVHARTALGVKGGGNN